ncbi:MAG: MmgE/PrpD family protein [Pseudorhodoplanes sp.]
MNNSPATLLPGSEMEADFVARVRELPAKITENHRVKAARHIADFIGVLFAGMQVSEVRAFRSMLWQEQPRKNRGRNADLIVDPDFSERENASYIGTAGHFHDYDDDEPAVLIGHPTIVVASTVFAVASAVDCDTRDALDAYIAGVEAAMTIGACVNPNHYNAGWHATASLGIFGAAVAAGILKGASDRQLVHTIGFAASQSSGLKGGFGSMAKPMQVGAACANAILATNLALAGQESAPGMVFGPSGFCAMHAPQTDYASAIARMGSPMSMDDPGFNIKLYPCCSSSHTAVDGALECATAETLTADDIARVDIWIGEDVPLILIYDFPENALQAKFCLRYPVAVALLRGDLTLDDFAEERIRDAEIDSLMRRIHVHLDPALPRAATGVTHCSRVVITTTDGRRVERFTEHPRGSAARPLSEQALRKKFVKCAAGSLGEQGAMRVFEAALSMTNPRPMREFVASLQAP